MRIHHLNCGCMCPIGGALFDGFSRGLTACLICHCLLVETEQGLVLIDTGFGERDIKAPLSRLSPFFINLNRIQFEEKYTALAAIKQLGYEARDVRHIVLTHLDFDHAGGLEDFPEATVHVMQAEIEAAQERRGFIAQERYRPGQWDGVKHWEYYSAGGEPWFGFEAVRDLHGLPEEILLIPLAGHTLSSCWHCHQDTRGLAPTCGRCLLLSARNGNLQTTLHTGSACLPMVDGGRPQGSTPQSRTIAYIIALT